MKDYNRINKKEIEFLSKYSEDFHEAMKILINKVNGPKLDDPKYWELKTQITKLNEKLDKLQEFIENKTGGY